MKIGIYTKSKTPQVIYAFKELINILLSKNIQIWLNDIASELYNELNIIKSELIDYKNSQTISADLFCLITIGGDGTFISCVKYPKPRRIPTLGINTGKLGFLADILPNEITETIDRIINNQFEVEKRTLLKTTINDNSIIFPHALNEIAILKHHVPKMIKIHTYINDVFLTSYWADGVIIATPTGSTAYSMSAGGPIIHPRSKSLAITPVAPHNLSNRPIVIPQKSKIRLKVESLDGKFLASIDAKSHIIDDNYEITIEKSEEQACVIKMKENHFYNTLRDKLMWGIDKRN